MLCPQKSLQPLNNYEEKYKKFEHQLMVQWIKKAIVIFNFYIICRNLNKILTHDRLQPVRSLGRCRGQ